MGNFLTRLKERFPVDPDGPKKAVPIPIFKAGQLAYKGYKAFSGGKKAVQSVGAATKLAPKITRATERATVRLPKNWRSLTSSTGATRTVPINVVPSQAKTVPINVIPSQAKAMGGAQRFFKRAKRAGEKLDNIDEVQMVNEAEEEEKQKKDYLSKQGLSRAAILSGLKKKKSGY